MATATWKSHRYLGATEHRNPEELMDQFEFDEADIWSTNETIYLPESKKSGSNPRPRKPVRKSATPDHGPIGPVNIPDWSKILRGEYRTRAWNCEDDREFEEEVENGNDRIPPHEYLARTRVASFSVHEGIGRTLKGRDLRRVRNAIWKQTGFVD